jgi:hypothetical protein
MKVRHYLGDRRTYGRAQRRELIFHRQSI